MATHSSILASKIPWMEEEPGGSWSSPQGCKEWDTTEQLHFHFFSCSTARPKIQINRNTATWKINKYNLSIFKNKWKDIRGQRHRYIFLNVNSSPVFIEFLSLP